MNDIQTPVEKPSKRYQQVETGSAQSRGVFYGPPAAIWPELLVRTHIRRFDLGESKLCCWTMVYESDEPFPSAEVIRQMTQRPLPTPALSAAEMTAVAKHLGGTEIVFVSAPGFVEDWRRQAMVIKGPGADSEAGPVYRAGMDVVELAGAMMAMAKECGFDEAIAAELEGRLAALSELMVRTFQRATTRAEKGAGQ